MFNVCQLFGICIYADNLNSFTFNNRTGSSPNILDVKENNFTFIFTISQFSQLEAVQTSSHCHLPSMPGRSLPRSENNKFSKNLKKIQCCLCWLVLVHNTPFPNLALFQKIVGYGTGSRPWSQSIYCKSFKGGIVVILWQMLFMLYASFSCGISG